MPLPTIAGVLRCTVSGRVAGGGPWSNTWHIGKDDESSWTIGQIGDTHDIFKQIYLGPNISAGQAVGLIMRIGSFVDEFNYTPLDGSSGAYEFTVGLEGIGTVSAMPAQTAQVLTIRTALRGRQNRGRVFLPAFDRTQYDELGHIVPSAISGVVSQVISVGNLLIAAGQHIGVGSYGPYKDPATGLLVAGTPHFTPAISYSMDERADVQRRRKA